MGLILRIEPKPEPESEPKSEPRLVQPLSGAVAINLICFPHSNFHLFSSRGQKKSSFWRQILNFEWSLLLSKSSYPAFEDFKMAFRLKNQSRWRSFEKSSRFNRCWWTSSGKSTYHLGQLVPLTLNLAKMITEGVAQRPKCSKHVLRHYVSPYDVTQLFAWRGSIGDTFCNHLESSYSIEFFLESALVYLCTRFFESRGAATAAS